MGHGLTPTVSCLGIQSKWAGVGRPLEIAVLGRIVLIASHPEARPVAVVTASGQGLRNGYGRCTASVVPGWQRGSHMDADHVLLKVPPSAIL